jgi:hypothetical protein
MQIISSNHIIKSNILTLLKMVMVYSLKLGIEEYYRFIRFLSMNINTKIAMLMASSEELISIS